MLQLRLNAAKYIINKFYKEQLLIEGDLFVIFFAPTQEKIYFKY